MKELLLTITLILNGYLFYYLYSRRDYRRRFEYISTYITLASSMVWIATNLLFLISDPSKLYWAAILSYISAIFSLFGVLFFLVAFNNEGLGHKQQVYLSVHIMLAIVLSAYVSIPGLVLREIITTENSFLYVTTPYLNLYGLYIFFLFANIVFIGVRTFRRFTQEQRARAQLFLYSSILAIFWSIIFNLLLPMFDQYQYTWLGPFSMAFWVASMIYSIVRYRLFDIRFGIGYTIYSLISGSIAIAFFYIVYLLQTALWESIFTRQAILSGLFLAVLYIRIQKFADNFIYKRIERYFIYSGVDPYQIVQDLSRNLSISLSLSEISKQITSSITRFIDIKKISLVALGSDNDSKPFIKGIEDEAPVENLESDITGFIFNWQKFMNSKVLIRAELETKALKNNELQKLLQFLEKYGFEIGVPLVSVAPEELVTGAILIGKQEQNRPYTDKEIMFFQDISQISSVSISRALLHQEVQQFNLTLQKKVDSATKELTERNEELEDLYKNLEDIYKKEKDLMDVAGHEFRTPASILKNNLYLLKKRLDEIQKGKPDEKVQKYLDRLMEGTDRQIKLVDTFLESARIDNERFEIQVESVNLTEMVTTAVSEMKTFATQKNLGIMYTPPEKQIIAEVDKIRIREVIDNLLNNALKYTKQGHLEPRLEETERTVRFSVKDTGIGIKPEDRALLFKKFSRVDNYIGGEEGSIVRPGGTGLGLFVAKTIIDAHGGVITVDSTPGAGSTFTFEIPKFQPSYVKRMQEMGSGVYKPQASPEVAPGVATMKTEVVPEVAPAVATDMTMRSTVTPNQEVFHSEKTQASQTISNSVPNNTLPVNPQNEG